MAEELADVVQDVHHARLIVDDGDRRRAEAETANAAGTVEIQGDIVFREVRVFEFQVAIDEAHAEAAGVHALRLTALPDAAAVLFDEVATGHAHRQLDAFRLVDVPRDGIQFRPVTACIPRVLRVGRHAERLEPVVAVLHDLRDAGHRFDVIHDRRLAERTFDGRERRLDSRPRPLAFE